MTFPLALDLGGRLCVVIGRSEDAASRVARLLEAGARVRWVTRGRHSTSTLASELVEREWQEQDLDDCWLAVLSDRDAQVAARIRAACDERCLFFCAVDHTALNTFNHVAVVRQGTVQVAISTDGKAPALARRLRVSLEQLLGDGRLQRFAERLAKLRAATPPARRKQAMDDALRGFAIEGRLVLPGERSSD